VTARLRLAVPAEKLFAQDAAYMARTDIAQMRLLGVADTGPDSLSTQTMGLWPGRPTVRHRAGATDAILRLMDDAGIDVAEDMHLFSSADEAENAASLLVERGYRLQSVYPLPPGRWPDAVQVVPAPLWTSLNAKDQLAALVDPANLAKRAVLTPAAAVARGFHGPVWVKLGGAPATAFGFAVRFCPDAPSFAKAIEDIAGLTPTDTTPTLIVEDHIDIGTCWCACIVVTAEETLFAGSAAQVFAAPGSQTGSLIDPADAIPPEAVPLVLAVGDAARKRGFTGLAGLDLGRARNGRIVVLDPNFRINASSAQILFHDCAVKRSGLPVSLSLAVASSLPMDRIVALLDGPVRDHLFIPTRLFDAALIPAALGQSAVNGFVMGRDPADAGARAEMIKQMLGGPAG
jgi:hypothetical protein